MAEKIGDAGGNAYMMRVLKKTVRKKRTLGAHKTNTITKSRASGEGVQARDNRLKPLHQFGIAVSEFMKCSCLFLKYGED